jgi:hypothetical protein
MILQEQNQKGESEIVLHMCVCEAAQAWDNRGRERKQMVHSSLLNL